MKLCTIGIDIGSTSSKGVLYDMEAGHVLCVEGDATRPAILGLPTGHYEEDPVLLRDAAYGIIARLANYVDAYDCKIASICFTGQMHGGLLVDEKLQPLTNFVTWQDKRGDELVNGNPLAQTIREKILKDEREAIGTDIHTGFLGVTYAWWKQKGLVPEKAKLIGIYDWIASTLTGKLTSDPSSIAAWGLYTIKGKHVSQAACDACGISAVALPEIVDTDESIGPISLIRLIGPIGMLEGITVISGMGDTQASYIGSDCRQDEILLNFGTGSQLMIETKDFGRYWGTDTRYLTKDSYLIVAPTLAGGKAYSILADFFIDVLASFDVDVFDRQAIFSRMNEFAMHGESEVQFTPHFLGSRTHGENLRASLSHLDAGNFRAATVTRALLEGMIAEVKEPYDRLPSYLHSHNGIVASGNGMRRNLALQQIASETFRLPLRMTAFEEEAALGAAITAARAV